jgi:hypothetical protein
MNTEIELRRAMSEYVAGVTASPDLVDEVRRRHHRRGVRIRVLASAGIAAVTVGALPVYGLVTTDRSGPVTLGPSAPPASGAATSCVANVPSRLIPKWARAGFTAAEPRIPYVLGARGDIVALLFGNPLAAPPRRDLSNKILWVSRVALIPGDPLIIEARLDGSRTTVRRTVPGGPGPSYLDLPQAGCWHLTLTWSQHTDTLDLRYTPQPG